MLQRQDSNLAFPICEAEHVVSAPTRQPIQFERKYFLILITNLEFCDGTIENKTVNENASSG